ncbi:nuclear transport factor 2 family protein [Baaleninema sp.]|uniref:nuclear transport factor 2 family protein n=1 Tax=Baaleninema sp. TaxID=3101197 RepID=UPI003D014E8F
MFKRTMDTAAIAIDSIDEPVVCRYFETLNTGEFENTAQLFAETGALHPPFEEAVVGREAIALYLETEAEGIACFPKRGEIEGLDDGTRLVKVAGKVKMPLFGVNVGWTFHLDDASQLLSVKIKLVASPQELLNLKQFA